MLLLRRRLPVETGLGGGVQGVHVQLGDPHQEARPGEGRLVLLVVAHHMAGVLAQEALDALAELLRAVHIDLLHPVVARLHPLRRDEGGDLARLGVVERHVRHQVAHHGEGPQRGDRDRLLAAEDRHPRHAQQPRPSVDLRAARTALSRLAVPAHRQIARLGGLDAVDDVEDDLAVVDLDLEVLQTAAPGVPAPHPEPCVVAAHS